MKLKYTWNSILHNHLYLRILVLFLAILVPAATMVSVIYWRLSKSAQQEAEQDIKESLDIAVLEIDAKMRSIHEIGYILSTEKSFKELDLSEADVSEDIANINKAYSTLTKMLLVLDDFVDSAALYMEADYVLTSAGFFPFELYYGKFHQYADYDGEYLNGLISNKREFKILPATGLMKYYGEYEKNVFVVPITMFFRLNNGHANFIFDVRVDTLLSIIDDNRIYDDMSYAIFDSDENVILNQFGDTDLATSDDISRLFIDDEKTTLARLKDGRMYLLCRNLSYYSGYYYYSMTPIAIVNEKIDKIFLSALAIVSVIAVVGVLMSVVFSLKIYNPIKNIRDLIKNNSKLEQSYLTSFNDLENDIYGLLDERRDIEEKHNKFARKYMEFAVPLMLVGSVESGHVILGNILRSQFGFSNGPYKCMVISTGYNREVFSVTDKEEQAALLSGINGIFKSIIEEYFPSFDFDYRYDIKVFIIEVDEGVEEALIERVSKEMFNTLSDESATIRIGITVGSTCESIEKLPESFNECLTLLRQLNPDQLHQLLFANHYTITSNYTYSFKDENRLIDYLAKGDMNEVIALIDDILLSNFEKGVSHTGIERLYNELYNTALRFATQTGIATEALPEIRMKLDEINLAGGLLNTDTQRRQILAVFDAVVQNTSIVTEQEHSKLVDTVLKYIENHYSEDLYLDILASVISITPKYLSRIFKEKMGVNLSDYINEVRIKYAKELLIHTDKKVSKIAKDVGFIHRTTFLRVFKKLVGLAPSAFREINRI